ncbi:MAG: hypothetical protein ACOY0T_16090 [Myxococcota bacterium]
MSGVRGWLFGVIGLVFAAPACDGDHSALAKGSSGGQGGRATAQGGNTLASGGFNQPHGNGGTTASGGRAPDESPGENVLSVVHGVVDAGPSLFCFAKGDAADAPLLGVPAPEGGLSYAKSWVVRAVEGVDFAADALSTWIISGDLSLVAGLDCEQAVAVARSEEAAAPPSASGAGGAPGAGGAGGAGGANGSEDAAAGEGGGPASEPPRLRAGRLPTVPAGTLSVGRSALLVANGCIGGEAFDSRLAPNACGAGYSGKAPSLSAVLVQMSRRTSPFRLGLQVVHASLASPKLSVISAPTEANDALRGIAFDVELGEILPRVPDLSADAASYGVNGSDWRLEMSSGSATVYAEPWSSVLRNAGFTSLSDGETFALVIVGPGLGLPLSRHELWNPSRVVLLPTDPK